MQNNDVQPVHSDNYGHLTTVLGGDEPAIRSSRIACKDLEYFAEPTLVSNPAVIPLRKYCIYLPLTQEKSTLVDVEDLPLLAAYRFTALQMGSTTYAKAHCGSETVYLHRLLMFGGPAKRNGLVVDHIDGDGLDNRRSNLRAVSHRQNMMNTNGKPRTRKTAFKGVSVRKHASRPYRATIEIDSRQKHLGYFASASEAAQAYDRAARAYFGPHARVNFPENKRSAANKEAA